MLFFCIARGEKGKGNPKKTQQSFPIHKEEGQNDQQTGRHLSYKQEITKIINEFSNDQTQTIQDVFSYFLSLRSHITTHLEKHFLFCDGNVTMQLHEMFKALLFAPTKITMGHSSLEAQMPTVQIPL